MSQKLQVKLLTKNAIIPKKGTNYSAGYDLFANEDCIVKSKDKLLVGTGISIAIPEGYY